MTTLTFINLFLITVMGISALTDIRTGKIYNSITYPAIGIGILMSALVPSVGLGQSLLGIGVALIFFGGMWVAGGLGAGDVKLMVAIGAVKGSTFLLASSVNIVVIGCLMGLGVLAWRGRLWSALAWVGKMLVWMVSPWRKRPVLVTEQTTIPFGPAICLGALVTLLNDVFHFIWI